MTCIRWPLTLIAFYFGTAALPAQGLLLSNPYSLGYVDTGFTGSYQRVRHHGGLGFSFGFARRGYALGPPLYSFSPPISRVTVLYYSPPPVVLLPQPRLLLEGLPPDILPRNRLEEPPLPEPP